MLADSEKKHRLPREVYKGPVSVAYTACTKNRAWVFVYAERVELASQILLNEAARGKCDVPIYLFMPDHVHIMLKGAGEESDSYAVMRSFKQKTGYLFSKAGLGTIWQKDFYDHILRSDDDFSNHVRYILNNPVRKGLSRTWQEYPLKGSTLYNLEQWNAD